MTPPDVLPLPRRDVVFRHGQWVVLDRQTGHERPADCRSAADEHLLLAHFLDVILDRVRPAAFSDPPC